MLALLGLGSMLFAIYFGVRFLMTRKDIEAKNGFKKKFFISIAIFIIMIIIPSGKKEEPVKEEKSVAAANATKKDSVRMEDGSPANVEIYRKYGIKTKSFKHISDKASMETYEKLARENNVEVQYYIEHEKEFVAAKVKEEAKEEIRPEPVEEEVKQEPVKEETGTFDGKEEAIKGLKQQYHEVRDVAILEDGDKLTMAIVVNDGTSKARAADMADSLIRLYGSIGQMGKNLKSPGQYYLGEIYEKYDLDVAVAPISKPSNFIVRGFKSKHRNSETSPNIKF